MERHDDSNHLPPRCERCLYFQERDYTGYCQVHEMYVLRTFQCSKFAPRPGSVVVNDADQA
ncbi:hypothetical protein U27_05907 [Candidatus Vecturithrix granuli]|uniref:Uncharacterized protein n=1 Tax=Vecturithrix granuli TaxID=1499967 RepID=A0A081C2X7_VECG1|nr:hypothetical protein U27_05907 [Candidatus Vecturithrix granuli]